MKNKIINTLLIAAITIASACNSNQSLKKITDPSFPKDLLLKIYGDTCLERSGGLLKVVDVTYFYGDKGKVNDLSYYWIDEYILKVEAIKDDGYARCYHHYSSESGLDLLGFKFDEHPYQPEISVNNQRKPEGIDSSVRIIKGKYFFIIDSNISFEPILLVKHENGWALADKNERSLIIADREKGVK